MITAISNVALNARQNAVDIPPHLLPLFKHHNNHVDWLCYRRNTIPTKWHLILQKSAALSKIVPLLVTMLGYIGGEFISRLSHKND